MVDLADYLGTIKCGVEGEENMACRVESVETVDDLQRIG